MNESICSEIRKRYNLQIGTRTAKRLKMVMGRLSDQKKGIRKVVGIDSISGLPREEVISSYVVNDGIMNCLNEIAAEMKTFLERIPPQISYHIAKQGIYITGEVPDFHILTSILPAIRDLPLICRICMRLRQSQGWKRLSKRKICGNGQRLSSRENYDF